MSVVLIDAVRTPFGKAGSMYNGTRADDLVVRAIRGLLERNPQLNPADIDDVAIAAATQTGDQGMNIGRSAALLAGIPNTVPGYSVDRWCAGAMTSVTTLAGAIHMGAAKFAIAGGVEHMGNHPIGGGLDPNPRYLAEKIVEQAKLLNFSKIAITDQDTLSGAINFVQHCLANSITPIIGVDFNLGKSRVLVLASVTNLSLASSSSIILLLVLNISSTALAWSSTVIPPESLVG